MTAVLLLLTVESAVVVFCYEFPTPIQAQLDIRPKKHAKKGTLASGEPGKVKPVEAGSFRAMLSQLPTIETDNRGCNIERENSEKDHYSSRISLYLKGTGRLIDDTTCVDPGYYMENIRLEKSLPAKEYPTIVRIGLFKEKIPAGEMSTDITLRIIERQEGEIG